MSEEINKQAVKEVLDEFRRLHKSCHELMMMAVKKHDIDISPEQSKLLFMIYHDKFSNQSDLAKKLRISPATLSVRIQRLESGGYLRRKVDANDKRNYVLEVETKGKELIDLSHKVMNETMEQLFVGFSQEDFKLLTMYINRLKQNVKDIKGEV